MKHEKPSRGIFRHIKWKYVAFAIQNKLDTIVVIVLAVVFVGALLMAEKLQDAHLQADIQANISALQKVQASLQPHAAPEPQVVPELQTTPESKPTPGVSSLDFVWCPIHLTDTAGNDIKVYWDDYQSVAPDQEILAWLELPDGLETIDGRMVATYPPALQEEGIGTIAISLVCFSSNTVYYGMLDFASPNAMQISSSGAIGVNTCTDDTTHDFPWMKEQQRASVYYSLHTSATNSASPVTNATNSPVMDHQNGPGYDLYYDLVATASEG